MSVFMNASLRSSTFSADKLGIWASAFCVVHCVLTPVLVSMSVVLAHLIPGEERTHRTVGDGDRGIGCARTGARVSYSWAASGSWADGAGAGICRRVLGNPIAIAWV